MSLWQQCHGWGPDFTSGGASEKQKQVEEIQKDIRHNGANREQFGKLLCLAQGCWLFTRTVLASARVVSRPVIYGRFLREYGSNQSFRRL